MYDESPEEIWTSAHEVRDSEGSGYRESIVEVYGPSFTFSKIRRINLFISRCCFVEDRKEMYKDL